VNRENAAILMKAPGIEMIERDLCKYLESIAGELETTKDRIRNLIGSAHWLTEGTHKEILLRSVLQRHLPEELKVCTGFIYKNANISSQIDILVISKSGYTLFKEGDLIIVTPHAVKAIIEVKTNLDGPSKIEEILKKLAENAELAEQELVQNRGQVWSGLFVYGEEENAKDTKQKQLLEAIAKVDSNGGTIDFVTYGPDIFIKFFSSGGPGPMWASHECKSLAAGGFVMDMLASLTRYPGYSDFNVLNKLILSGKAVPRFQIKRGEKMAEKVG